MNSVISRLLIYIVCAMLQLQNFRIDMIMVIGTLFSLILGFLDSVFPPDNRLEKRKRIAFILLYCAYCIAATWFPPFLCFLPLLVYNICAYKLMINAGFLCFDILLSFFIVSPQFAIYIIILCLICALFQYEIHRSDGLKNELKALRDNSKEHEMIVEEKNRTLRENQDAKIYMATLKERNRIAREIHDNVGHMLTRSILQVGAIKTINQNEALVSALDDLHGTLNTAMTSIRSSVHDLHDESIDLYSAISEIIAGIDGLDITFDYDMGENIPKDIKYCFISVTKEALNNILKHSNATKMDILVREHPGFYQLQIQDNGTNIKLEPEHGIGLTNIKDRVKSLNGNLKISTDSGFKILISIIKNMEETPYENNYRR